MFQRKSCFYQHQQDIAVLGFKHSNKTTQLPGSIIEVRCHLQEPSTDPCLETKHLPHWPLLNATSLWPWCCAVPGQLDIQIWILLVLHSQRKSDVMCISIHNHEGLLKVKARITTAYFMQSCCRLKRKEDGALKALLSQWTLLHAPCILSACLFCSKSPGIP